MKILIVRLSSLGDIILTQPICALLQREYPEAELFFVCKREYEQLPLMFSPPVQVIPYEKSVSYHLKLRKTYYDVIIDLHGKFASILLSILLKSKTKTRYNKMRSLRKAIVAGDKSLQIDSTVQLYANSLRKLGINADWEYPKMVASNVPAFVDSSQQQSVVYETENNLIAIFPGATHHTKRYPVESWIEFINIYPNYSFALYGGASDEEICSLIVNSVKSPCTNYTGKYKFAELLLELSKCRLIISGDTGPMHLAATLNKPQIAIFGGTHPRLGFRPLNNYATILCADLPCQPCSLHGDNSCPQGHFNCMKMISPKLLSDTVHQILNP